MWEVMSFGERPYWDMSNQDVSVPQPYQAFLDWPHLGCGVRVGFHESSSLFEMMRVAQS